MNQLGTTGKKSNAHRGEPATWSRVTHTLRVAIEWGQENAEVEEMMEEQRVDWWWMDIKSSHLRYIHG